LIKGLEKNTFKDSEPSVVIWAHMAIIAINQKVDGDNLKAIAAMIEKKDLRGKIQAAQSIATLWQSPKAKMGPREAKIVLPYLLKGLSDKEPAVMFWCMWTLASMKKDGQPAIKPLTGNVNDPNRPEEVKQIP